MLALKGGGVRPVHLDPATVALHSHHLPSQTEGGRNQGAARGTNYHLYVLSRLVPNLQCDLEQSLTSTRAQFSKHIPGQDARAGNR